MAAMDYGEFEEDFLYYSMLYSIITLVFAMAVLTKFLRNDFRFGVRSFLSLFLMFVGEPLCHFAVRGPSGVLMFGVGCAILYTMLPASHLSGKNRTVLITGCDSGFGHALAKKLDSSGLCVYAGCLFADGPGAIELKNSCSSRLRILQLNVTKDEDIEKAFDMVQLDVGSEGLWGLVNNAGIWYASDIEMTSEKIFRKILDVNLFGVIKMTKKFLPLIRQAKGRVVNMSSVAGKIPMESSGAYTVSKYGLEAYSDCLRLEMKRWGVSVSLVEPAGFYTGATHLATVRQRRDEVWHECDALTRRAYGRAYLDRLYENYEGPIPSFPKDLTPAVRALTAGLLSRRPRARYTAGLGAGTLLALFPLLPPWLADRVVTVIGFAVRDVQPTALLQ